MKALVLTSVRHVELQEAPLPILRQPHEVLLRVERVGICGSDIHYFEDCRIGPRQVEFPFIMGHECSATVVEIGSAVRRVKPGDQAAVDPAVSCHSCDQCQQGREHTCRNLAFLGCPEELPGCLSEYLVMPELSVYPLAAGLSLEQGVLCEPLSIAIYAVQLSRLRAGETIAILGAGPIGCCVLAAGLASGARRAYVTDRIPERVANARRAGAAWAGNPDREPIVDRVLEQEPLGMDVVFECAGQQSALDQAVALLKPGGRLMVVGIPREERVSFAIDHLRRKEITLINVRRQNRCVPAAVELMHSQPERLSHLVTHRFTPEQGQEAFELVAGYRQGVLKAIIDFSASG